MEKETLQSSVAVGDDFYTYDLFGNVKRHWYILEELPKDGKDRVFQCCLYALRKKKNPARGSKTNFGCPPAMKFTEKDIQYHLKSK